MEQTKVIIENWPRNFPIIEIVSVVIAIAALVFSYITLKRSQEQSIKDKRPYVWGQNYSFGEPKVMENEVMKLFVLNAPAKISTLSLKIYTGKTIHHHELDEKSKKVRYPNLGDENRIWFIYIAKPEWNVIPKTDNLKREVLIKYTALDRDITYTYSVVQTFNVKSNSWSDGDENAN